MSTPLMDIISDNRRMVEELNEICLMPQKLNELRLTLRNHEAFLIHLTNTRDAAKLMQCVQSDYSQFLLANSNLLESFLKKEFLRLSKANNSAHPTNWTIPPPRLPFGIIEKLRTQHEFAPEMFVPKAKSCSAINTVTRCFRLYYNKQHFKLKGALKRNEYLATELENHIKLKEELEAEQSIIYETIHALELAIHDVQSEIDDIRKNEFILEDLVKYRQAAKTYFIQEYTHLQNMESADTIFTKMHLHHDTRECTNELEYTPQSSFIVHYPVKWYSRPSSNSNAKISPLYESFSLSSSIEPSSTYSTDEGTLSSPATLESLRHIKSPIKSIAAVSTVFSPAKI